MLCACICRLSCVAVLLNAVCSTYSVLPSAGPAKAPTVSTVLIFVATTGKRDAITLSSAVLIFFVVLFTPRNDTAVVYCRLSVVFCRMLTWYMLSGAWPADPTNELILAVMAATWRVA